MSYVSYLKLRYTYVRSYYVRILYYSYLTYVRVPGESLLEKITHAAGYFFYMPLRGIYFILHFTNKGLHKK